MTEILFVHGALVQDGAWWWRPVARVLETAGVRSSAIELPSCGEGGATAESGLVEDAAALRRALDGVHDDAIVVGHSYGGTVIAEGADHPGVRHLVYISSYLPHIGQAQSELLGGEADPVAVRPRSDGTVEIDGFDLPTFSARFVHDVTDAAVRAAAWERVTAQSIAAFTTPTTAAAWQGRDSTYLVCAEDHSTSVGLQREHALRASRSVELPTGHHPFLSRPELIIEQLLGLLD